MPVNENCPKQAESLPFRWRLRLRWLGANLAIAPNMWSLMATYVRYVNSLDTISSLVTFSRTTSLALVAPHELPTQMQTPQIYGARTVNLKGTPSHVFLSMHLLIFAPATSRPTALILWMFSRNIFYEVSYSPLVAIIRFHIGSCLYAYVPIT